MRVTSIETTPNPNSMKLNLDQAIDKRETYTAAQRQGCPKVVDRLLDIHGVQSIFVCHDFVTLNRDPRADWQPILDKANQLLDGSGSQMSADSTSVEQQRLKAEKEGQVCVSVQTFRGIPIQVKATSGPVEKRISIDPRFNTAAQLIQDETGAAYLTERHWDDWGIRYGSADQVAAEVADEIAGTIDDKSLSRLTAQALGKVDTKTVSKPPESLREELKAADWHNRLKAVQELGTDKEALAFLAIALQDSHPQVRRLAAAALGATGSTEAVAPLCQALLNDQSVGVRRTAGDALSDLGDVSAQSAACHALTDANKLIRWRAARLLAEIGTEEALPSLIAVAKDPEFEVRLEIEAAIQRIKGGLDRSIPAWKRILENR